MTDSYIKEGEGLPDFILMSELSENALYDNLVLRYQKDLIYTYIGNVVVSVNPYKQLSMYSPEVTKRYNGRYPHENDPHIFALADMSFRQLFNFKTNQAIIISGESGAGKTEASKQVMRYIADVTPTSKSQDMIKIKDQLLDSNPILEAFGNAKTLRNDNSSRFGKYMQIQFDGAGVPVGGVINVYLLEKSRVVTRAKDERAFHIFYHLLKGADDGLLSALSLTRDAASYRYLSLSGCYEVPSISDQAEFRAVTSAMNTLNFAPDQQKSIWRAVAAVLHLGNVAFEAAGDAAKIVDESVVKRAADLLDLPDAGVLSDALLNRTVNAEGKQIRKPLSLSEAQYARDALCKSLYERVFLSVVKTINVTIENTEVHGDIRIGLLDIYGFEVFERNSFEQMCINWTNEKLQQVFIERTLKQEQEEYEREGIEWTPVEYFNNKIICDLIEAKPQGIIAILDEACLMTKTEDLFLKNIGDAFNKHAHYDDFNKSKNQKIGNASFMLKHYAGDVVYEVAGFLDKNNDQLFRDLQLAIQSSTSEHISTLFPKLDDSKKRPETAGSQFRRSVNELVDMLMSCQPHYVRCVKPNDEKLANNVNEERVRHQIRYLGLLENVRVRRAGFAYRAEYDRFARRYKLIGERSFPLLLNNDERQTSEYLVKDELGTDPATGYRLGKTKIFLKDPKTLFALEDRRKERLPAIANTLVTQARAYLQRSAMQRARAILVVQKYARRWREQTAYAAKVEAYRRDMKANELIGFFRALVFKKYFAKVNSTFADAASAPDLGRSLAWPQPPKALRDGYLNMQAIFEVWRAHVLITRLGNDRAEVQMKVRAFNKLHGQRAWRPAARYSGFKSLPRPGLEARGELLFVSDCNKLNTKGKLDPRTLLVSPTFGVAVVEPKKFKDKKPPLAFDDLQYVVISKAADSFMVLKAKPPAADVVVQLTPVGDGRVEYAALLIAEAAGVPLEVSASVDFDTARPKTGKAGSLSFSTSPDVPAEELERFAAGKKNAHTVVSTDQVDGVAAPGSWEPIQKSASFKRSKSKRKKKTRS